MNNRFVAILRKGIWVLVSFCLALSIARAGDFFPLKGSSASEQDCDRWMKAKDQVVVGAADMASIGYEVVGFDDDMYGFFKQAGVASRELGDSLQIIVMDVEAALAQSDCTVPGPAHVLTQISEKMATKIEGFEKALFATFDGKVCRAWNMNKHVAALGSVPHTYVIESRCTDGNGVEQSMHFTVGWDETGFEFQSPPTTDERCHREITEQIYRVFGRVGYQTNIKGVDGGGHMHVGADLLNKHPELLPRLMQLFADDPVLALLFFRRDHLTAYDYKGYQTPFLHRNDLQRLAAFNDWRSAFFSSHGRYPRWDEMQKGILKELYPSKYHGINMLHKHGVELRFYPPSFSAQSQQERSSWLNTLLKSLIAPDYKERRLRWLKERQAFTYNADGDGIDTTKVSSDYLARFTRVFVDQHPDEVQHFLGEQMAHGPNADILVAWP